MQKWSDTILWSSYLPIKRKKEWQHHTSSASKCQTDIRLVHAIDLDKSSMYIRTNKLSPMPPCHLILLLAENTSSKGHLIGYSQAYYNSKRRFSILIWFLSEMHEIFPNKGFFPNAEVFRFLLGKKKIKRQQDAPKQLRLCVCVFPNVDHKWHLFSLFGPQVYRTGLTAILGS